MPRAGRVPTHLAVLMRRFAELLERLAFTPARNGKLRLITDYLRETPDPDRGWGLAAITRDLTLDAVKPAMLRALDRGAGGRRALRAVLRLRRRPGRDHRADLARAAPGRRDDPPLAEVIAALRGASRREAPQVVERLLDRLDASGRFALLKLVTGGLRVGVSARLAKQALADFGAPRRHRDRGALARPGAALRRALRLAGRNRPRRRSPPAPRPSGR